MNKELESGEESLLIEQKTRTVNLFHKLLIQNYTQIIGIQGGPYLDPQTRAWMAAEYQALTNKNNLVSIINSVRNYGSIIDVLKVSKSFQALIIGIASVMKANSTETKKFLEAHLEANLFHIQADILFSDRVINNPDIQITASDNLTDAAKAFKAIESANINPQRPVTNPMLDFISPQADIANRGNAILLHIRDAPFIESVMQSDPNQLVTELIKHYPSLSMVAKATVRGSSWMLLNITNNDPFYIFDPLHPTKLMSSIEVKKVVDTLEHFFSD